MKTERLTRTVVTIVNEDQLVAIQETVRLIDYLIQQASLTHGFTVKYADYFYDRIAEQREQLHSIIKTPY